MYGSQDPGTSKELTFKLAGIGRLLLLQESVVILQLGLFDGSILQFSLP